jgi:hypothetical protein
MAAGRSYEQVDEMTCFDVALVQDYWADHPTADEILKLVHKIERRKEEPPVKPGFSVAEMQLIKARFPNGLMRADQF